MDKPIHAPEHFFSPKTGSEIFQQILLEHEYEIELNMVKREPLHVRPEAIARILESLFSQESLAEHS
jgi:hypothetical protein